MKQKRLINRRGPCLCFLAVGAFSSDAASQDLSIASDSLQAPPGSFRAAQELDLTTPSDFVSRPVGQQQKWKIDRGHFGNDDPGTSQFDDARSDDYSGIRLRRPRRY
jgi:hypothetical protein